MLTEPQTHKPETIGILDTMDESDIAPISPFQTIRSSSGVVRQQESSFNQTPARRLKKCKTNGGMVENRAPLFHFEYPIGPYQSALHVVKDNRDQFLKLLCNDSLFIETHFGATAITEGKRCVSTTLWGDCEKIQELDVVPGTRAMVTEFTKEDVVIKSKLPNLGGTSATLYLFVEFSLLYDGKITPYAGEWFSFERFSHLKKLAPEEVKKTGKKTRDKPSLDDEEEESVPKKKKQKGKFSFVN